jgi:hypothetical protein
MTLDELRKEMEAYRRSVSEEAKSLKDPYVALERLHQLYQRFDDKERAIADQVLAEWVLSHDINVRFDALALIREFNITKATLALRSLADRLSESRAVGAPDELWKVYRLLRKLGQSPFP